MSRSTNHYSYAPRGVGGQVVLTGDVMRTLVDVLPGFRAAAVRLLKRAGFINDAQLYARAFRRLEDELFRFPWVEGVVTRGFAQSAGDHRRRKEAYVEVVSFEAPDNEMRRDVDEAVIRLNRRFCTRLRAHVVERRRLDTAPRRGDPV